MLYYLRLKRGVAQLGSALGSGPRGRRFESCHSDQNSGWDLVSHPEFLLMRQARESACKLLRRRTFLTRQNAICRRSAQRALGLVQNPVTPTTKKQGHLCPCFFMVGRIALCSAVSSVPSQFGTKGERVKIPRCGVFTKRYPAKQRARRAEYPQATAGDYATGEGRAGLTSTRICVQIAPEANVFDPTKCNLPPKRAARARLGSESCHSDHKKAGALVSLLFYGRKDSVVLCGFFGSEPIRDQG